MRSSALLLVALAACGGAKQDARDEAVGSCNQPSIHGCVEYRGANLAAGTDNLAKLCSAVAPGDFKMMACPTAQRIGSCARLTGTDVYYEGYPIALPDAERSCKESNGTFAK